MLSIFFAPEKAWEFVRFQIYFFFFCCFSPLSLSLSLREYFALAFWLLRCLLKIFLPSHGFHLSMEFHHVSSRAQTLYINRKCVERNELLRFYSPNSLISIRIIFHANTKQDLSAATQTHTISSRVGGSDGVLKLLNSLLFFISKKSQNILKHLLCLNSGRTACANSQYNTYNSRIIIIQHEIQQHQFDSAIHSVRSQIVIKFSLCASVSAFYLFVVCVVVCIHAIIGWLYSGLGWAMCVG